MTFNLSGELEAVMEARTDDFDSLKTEELRTQWKHKISVVPESAGITTKWWTYSSGVSRVGPEAEVPAGEDITTDQSGEYIVGTPALAGGAARVAGTAQSGDDWWTGFTDRLNVADADDNGVGIGTDDQGDYVWFRSGVSGVSDTKLYRSDWNGDDLDVLPDSEVFHRGGFARIDHTFYNQGAADVNWGYKTGDGKLKVVTLHSFNVPDAPMWTESDLKWQMACSGANLTGYINAAHYKGGNADRAIRTNGTGRDGTVLGSDLSGLSAGDVVPVISIQLRSNWENVNIQPLTFSVDMDGDFYVFITTDSTLDGTESFQPPNSESADIDPADTEYAVLADNDATGFSDVGEIEELSYSGGSTGQGSNAAATAEGEAQDFSLSPGEAATVGVVAIGATSLNGASFNWGSNF